MIQQITQQTTLFIFPFIVFILVLVALIIFWIGALVSFLNTENMGEDRVVWAIIIVFTGPIGAILWFIIGRQRFRKAIPM